MKIYILNISIILFFIFTSSSFAQTGKPTQNLFSIKTDQVIAVAKNSTDDQRLLIIEKALNAAQGDPVPAANKESPAPTKSSSVRPSSVAGKPSNPSRTVTVQAAPIHVFADTTSKPPSVSTKASSRSSSSIKGKKSSFIKAATATTASPKVSVPKDYSSERPTSAVDKMLKDKRAGDYQQTSDFPGWLKRTSFGAFFESHRDARLYFETVQPLYQSLDMENTYFTQGRVSILGGSEDYSAGLGYRHLLDGDRVMLGINAFGDYKNDHHHGRVGLGFEAISNALEFRVNSYVGLTPKRLVYQVGTVKSYERAATGFDMEVGGSLPTLDFRWLDYELDGPISFPSWIKVFGGFYWYNMQESSDIAGWKVRGELNPFHGIDLNMTALGDNKDPHQYQVDIRFNIAVKDFRLQSIMEAIVPPAKSSNKDKPSLDTRTLDRVERSYEVKLESWSEGATSTSVGNLSNVQLVIRFPGVNPVTTDDNSDGFIDAGEEFELDVLMTNTSGTTSTGISFANAVASNPGSITINTSASLSDAPSGGTTRTNNATDMDLLVDAGASAGNQFTVTLDFTADGETSSLTFGPFTVGSMYHDQVINQT